MLHKLSYLCNVFSPLPYFSMLSFQRQLINTEKSNSLFIGGNGVDQIEATNTSMSSEVKYLKLMGIIKNRRKANCVIQLSDVPERS